MRRRGRSPTQSAPPLFLIRLATFDFATPKAEAPWSTTDGGEEVIGKGDAVRPAQNNIAAAIAALPLSGA